MKKFVPFLLIILMVSCSDDKPTTTTICGTPLSIDKIPAVITLKAPLTDCNCKYSIMKGTYEDQVVFYVQYSDTFDTVFAPVLYNCQGDIIRAFPSTLEAQTEFYEKVTGIKILTTVNNSK